MESFHDLLVKVLFNSLCQNYFKISQVHLYEKTFNLMSPMTGIVSQVGLDVGIKITQIIPKAVVAYKMLFFKIPPKVGYF